MKLRAVGIARGLFLLWASIEAADTARKSESRIWVTVDAHAQAELLAEMRAHLVNVQKLLEALSHKDLPGVARAARASGIASAVEATDDLMGHLPQGFIALGMSMHQGFDRLADKAAQGEDGGQLLESTSMILKQCVACHTTYQLRVSSVDAVRRAEH